MQILAYLASILIGVSLGMVGSGGSILTVPVLVYMMGFDPLQATTSSLFIVGVTSMAGGLRAYSRKHVDFKAVTEFGIPSIFSIFITRQFLLPAIPDIIVANQYMIISKGMFLMVVFAILMLGASLSMIGSKPVDDNLDNLVPVRHNKGPVLVLLGLAVGVVTGMLGAGGGFLIIPALVLFLRLPMKIAVGTSLLIIAINSLFGFLFTLRDFTHNWTVLILFTLLAILGIFIGSRLAEKISSHALKRGFGWFVLSMAIYIILRETVLST